MSRIIVALVFLTASPTSYTAEKTDFLKFFEDYQRLSAEFNSAVSKMYSNDAEIIGVRKKPDGTEETMTIDGTRWKTIILASMQRAKQLGDRSEFSNIAINVTSSQAKITATKYSALSCFSDDRFYMVIEASTGNQLKIVEQFTESPAQSSCEDSNKKLPDFLQTTVKMINDQLPATIDSETSLIKTSAEGTTLTYHYVLVNYTSKTLTTSDATAKLQNVVVQQSCGSPNLRPILDQDGTLSFIYNVSDGVQIARFEIDKSVCTD